MIKDFVIEYAKMEAHSANITAEKYENQDFKNHINLQVMNTWKLGLSFSGTTFCNREWFSGTTFCNQKRTRKARSSEQSVSLC
jgi:hypothetical protein